MVDAIESIKPETDSLEFTIAIVSPTKLEKNRLPEEVADFLKIGRKKEVLVQQYFDRHCQPNFGEKIAQAFQEKYQALKAMPMLSYDIFSVLQEFAGGMRGTPQRQSAVLAIISYLFERCDIFEDTEIIE